MATVTYTVMLIEDDETMLSLIQALLEIEGFNVVIPPGIVGIETVLTEIRRATPDLVLLDVNLRSFSGFDLLRQVRASNDLKKLRVIMSSGMEVRHDSLLLGADDFILKPYMPDELISKIREIFES